MFIAPLLPCWGVLFHAKRGKCDVLLRWCRTSASICSTALYERSDRRGRQIEEGEREGGWGVGLLVANLLLISEEYEEEQRETLDRFTEV